MKTEDLLTPIILTLFPKNVYFFGNKIDSFFAAGHYIYRVVNNSKTKATLSGQNKVNHTAIIKEYKR